MKRFITVFIGIILAVASYGQQLNPKGLYIGKTLPILPGSMIQRIDSALVDNMANPTTIWFFHGTDTLIFGIPNNGYEPAYDYLVRKHADTLLVTDATYQFVLTDDGRIVTGRRATGQQFTVPADATTDFPEGAVINVKMDGEGLIKFVPAAGVVFESAKDSVCINTKWGWATLVKRTTNIWSVFGALLD